MPKENILNEYETSYRLGHSFLREVVKYIERCHLEDGGYFFARVPPSSGLDTYFAVKSLSILGVKPDRPEAIANFFLNDVKDSSLGGMTGIFLTVEVLNELGRITDELRDYAELRTMALQNKAGGFGALENIDVEVASELQETYRAVKILKTIGADFDARRITGFINGESNLDGGYGKEGRSTLASTYYATAIYMLLGTNPPVRTDTLKYFRDTEERWRASFDGGRVNFIEDLYWLTLIPANLGEKTNVPDRVTRFVMMCQRTNGGFSRATIMGIPTLEYTFFALSILKEIGAL